MTSKPFPAAAGPRQWHWFADEDTEAVQRPARMPAPASSWEVAILVDCLGPLDLAQYRPGWRGGGRGLLPRPPSLSPSLIPPSMSDAGQRAATNPTGPYAHPSGAVSGVSLS